MNIERYGSERNRGTTAIISNLSFGEKGKNAWDDIARWDKRTKSIVLTAKWITHTDGKTNHNYEIRLTLDDVTSLIKLVGHAGSASDASLLRDQLAENIPALVKLLACATGCAPIPIPNDGETKDKLK